MYTINSCLLGLFILLSCCEAYKILVIFPLPGRSHGILGDGVVRNLLKDGNEVTYISPFSYKVPSPNLRVIDVSSNANLFPMDIVKFENFLNKDEKTDNFGDIHKITETCVNLHNITIHNENVRKLLNDPKEQFDLVVVEWLFTDVFSGFAAVYNCPYVWVSSLDIHWQIVRLIDEPTNPAYTVDILSLHLPPLTFKQRLMEFYTQVKSQFLRYMYFNDMEKTVYENSLAPFVVKRGRHPPPYSDIQYNASLVLGNSHVSLGQAASIPQSYKPVGGYHIEEDVKPLTENLKKIMDSAEYGVIYFSMGTNLKSKDMPNVIKDDLLKMFGELKQTIVWKFEEHLLNTPKNVHIVNWAPQQSILAHPKTILFITHGGLLSTTETVHFGVPIIAIPAFGDQFINTARAVKKGFAYKVRLSYEMAKDLKTAIEELTTNPKYTQKAKELSFVYHDRPVTPGKEMAHWARHVIETRGAPHLRSPALNMPLYQKLYLDLLVILAVILLIVCTLTTYACGINCKKGNFNTKNKDKLKRY